MESRLKKIKLEHSDLNISFSRMRAATIYDDLISLNVTKTYPSSGIEKTYPSSEKKCCVLFYSG